MWNYRRVLSRARTGSGVNIRNIPLSLGWAGQSKTRESEPCGEDEARMWNREVGQGRHIQEEGWGVVTDLHGNRVQGQARMTPWFQASSTMGRPGCLGFSPHTDPRQLPGACFQWQPQEGGTVLPPGLQGGSQSHTFLGDGLRCPRPRVRPPPYPKTSVPVPVCG